MVFGRRKEERVIEEEDERARRTASLAEFLEQQKILEEGLKSVHKIFLSIWTEIKNDRNIEDNIKFEFWKHETQLLTDIINKQGLFGLEATVKEVSKAIRAAILKAIEEAE